MAGVENFKSGDLPPLSAPWATGFRIRPRSLRHDAKAFLQNMLASVDEVDELGEEG